MTSGIEQKYWCGFCGKWTDEPHSPINAEDGKISLYDRLGGVFVIAAVVDKFSDAVLDNPKVGRDSPNPQLREWSRSQSEERLSGLKWMRTFWVCTVSGGPQKFVPTRDEPSQLDLSVAHSRFHITSDEFDTVAKILAETLTEFKVSDPEKKEVLAAFTAHKNEVIGI